LQARARDLSATSFSPEQLHEQLGPGQPLDEEISERASNSLRQDLQGVEVHPDNAAAPSIGAEAFTLGHHIAFAPGKYRPGTDAGDRLIAHELTHVVQQSGGSDHVQAAGRGADAYEQEAEQAARAIVAGDPVVPCRR
jgi:hypothetical protein